MLSNFNYRPGAREVRSTPVSVAGAEGPGHGQNMCTTRMVAGAEGPGHCPSLITKEQDF